MIALFFSKQPSPSYFRPVVVVGEPFFNQNNQVLDRLGGETLLQSKQPSPWSKKIQTWSNDRVVFFKTTKSFLLQAGGGGWGPFFNQNNQVLDQNKSKPGAKPHT